MTGLLRQGCGVGSPGFLFPMPAKELRVSLSEAPDDLTSWVAGEHPSFFSGSNSSRIVLYTLEYVYHIWEIGDLQKPSSTCLARL